MEHSNTRPDIREEDLHGLLVTFHERVAADHRLAPDFAGVDMVAHMPHIVDFWSTRLCHTGRYARNAFSPHIMQLRLGIPPFARAGANVEYRAERAAPDRPGEEGPEAPMGRPLCGRLYCHMLI